MYQKDLKVTKWRRDRIGIAKVRERGTERGKREIKNARVKDREEERERREWTKSCPKSASANCKKDTEEKEERGGGSTSTSRWFVFSLFPRGLLINYCD